MNIPERRCAYLYPHGQQCDVYFQAIDSNKLCPAHREVFNGKSKTEESKVRYIDLVNDERKYCYHFQDGTAQSQSQDLIFQFKDDEDGTVFEKIDKHIAFLDKVIEDLKARHSTARQVRVEKLDQLSEEERKILREHKIERAVSGGIEGAPRVPSFKKDPVGHLAKTKNMSRQDAEALLTMDEDALIEKFKKAKESKENA